MKKIEFNSTLILCDYIDAIERKVNKDVISKIDDQVIPGYTEEGMTADLVRDQICRGVRRQVYS